VAEPISDRPEGQKLSKKATAFDLQSTSLHASNSQYQKRIPTKQPITADPAQQRKHRQDEAHHHLRPAPQTSIISLQNSNKAQEVPEIIKVKKQMSLMSQSNKVLLDCQALIDEVNLKHKHTNELTYLNNCQTTDRIENAQ
jgi:hypothetical protein